MTDAGTGAWSVCLAVLGGLAVIVLLAARLRTPARRHSADRSAPGGAGHPPRHLIPLGGMGTLSR